MKNIKPFILLLLTTIIMGASCKKTKDPDPNSFYFQCKINGQDYIPGLGNGLTCELLGDTTFLLGGNIGYQALGFGLINTTGQSITTTLYILNDNPRYKGDYKYSTTTYDIFNTDSIHTGQVHIITLDRANKIIQGTFYFKAYNAYRNDSVSVTDGKFRLQYIIS